MIRPYERLANAIVLFAARDYKAALSKLKKDPDNSGAMQDALSLERFFHSQWYSVLTKVDGDYLIERLRKEVRAK